MTHFGKKKNPSKTVFSTLNNTENTFKFFSKIRFFGLKIQMPQPCFFCITRMCVFVFVYVCVCVCNCICVCVCLSICKFVSVCVFVFEVLIRFSTLWLKCLTFKREEDTGSSVIILVYKNEEKDCFRKKNYFEQPAESENETLSCHLITL